MHFQRFVAWENQPSLTSKSDLFESSSSSKSSVNEYESEGFGVPKVITTKKEAMPIHPVEIPLSVKQVLDKIEVAQLERAKKEISKKLFHILENVNRAYDRYKRDDGIDPKIEKEYNNLLTWEEKSRRSHLLDEIDDVLNINMGKLLDLRIVLDSLKECSGMLNKVRLQEKLIPKEEMIEKMEMDLMNFIDKTEVNVQRLIKLFQPLFTEKMRTRRKSGQKYALLFKAWRDKVADMPQEGEPLTPEQMLDDESLAFTRCHDVNNMIHELGESSFFNKAEIIALKYTATMVGNLIKAFSLLVKQCRNLKLKCDSLTIVEGRKQDPQVAVLQRELRMALDKKAALEKQVQNAEERCMTLLITNEMIQKELHDANEKTLLAGDITLPRVSSGKTQSKPSDVEKNVKSKQVEEPLHLTEPKKKLTRKGEVEILDEKWESQGEGSQISLISISGREQSPAGSNQDIKIKQRKIKKDKLPQQEDKLPGSVITSDKWKTKQPLKASDEKSPPMVETFTERSSERLNQMFTSHRTLDTESDRVAPKSSDEKPIESSPSTMEPSSLTELTAEDISGQKLQKDKKGARHKLSLKGTADKVVLAMKTKKVVKFPPTKDAPTHDIASQDITPLFTNVQERPKGELTQRPMMTSEMKKEPESLDKTLTKMATAEQTEEAPKHLADKSKDIREKKEPKRWKKLLQLPKQAEKFEGVRHGLDVKLQETARDIPISDTPIQDISNPDTPTQDTPTQDLPTLDTHSQDTPTKNTPILDTPTPDTPTLDTTTQDISRGELTQRPTMTSETKEGPESQDKDLTQTAATEQAEEAPKPLADKAKDTREKKETKRWSKLLQLPKQAEKFEGIRHGLDAKLQEIARDTLTPEIPTPDTSTQDISGGELIQRLTTTSEMKEKPESQDKNLTQTAIAEQAEEAPKQLIDKSKDIREKKETKRWNKLLHLPKKAEKFEGVKHGLDVKLQEISRDISTLDPPTRDIPTLDTSAQDIPGSEVTQKPIIETKEEPESQDKDLIQTAIAEQTEEAPKPLADKSKDVREKKETKRWSKLLQLPKQAEKFEAGIHGLNIKLQEIAREKDGMIDIETIKHLFEELEPSCKDTVAGPVTGGRHADKPAKIFNVKKSTLPPDTAEQASTTKEKRRSSRVEENALREFQEATLACLEDKLEKLKKGPLGNGKVSVQFQPTDPHVQQLFKAIHDKVEECFLIKQKSFIHLEDDTVQHISQSMEKLEDKNGEEITKTPSTTHVIPTQDIHAQDTPTQDMPTLFTPTQETPTEVTCTRDIYTQDTSPQVIPTLFPPPQEIHTLVLPPPPQEIPTLVTPSKDTPTQVLPPGPQDILRLVPPPLETPTLFLPPQEIPTLLPQSQDIPSLFPPPQDIRSLVPPPQDILPLVPTPYPQDILPLVPPPLEIPPLFPPPQDIPTLVPFPSSQDIPTLVPLLLEMPTMFPPPQDIPTLVPPSHSQDILTLVPPPQDIPTLVPLPPPQDTVPLVLPPQDIPTLVPPPQDIVPLVPPPQDIPTLFLPPPPQDITPLVPPLQDILPLVPPPQDIPICIQSPQDIPNLFPPPPPQDITPLVPPVQDILPLVPPPQDIPIHIQPPQDIPTLFPLPPPQDIPPLVLVPKDIPALFPPPQDILTLVLPPLDITNLVSPPADISTLVLPPQDMPILAPPPQGKESFSPQDVLLPKWQEKEEDLAKALPITKEEQSLEHVPDEGDQQVKELKHEEQDKSKIIIPVSEKQPKTVDKAREPSPKVSHLKLKSLQELNIKSELWYQQLQKELLTEKERIQEEQLRLRGECQRIEKDKENLVQLQGLFHKQQEEWRQKQEQHKEQEHLWQLQLKQWQRLQQQNDHYQQFWAEQREKQKEQQCRLQEEVRQLQQQYKQQVILQGEQAKEQWCWNQLREEHRKQQKIWQEEDKEYEIKRKQWQQQQAKHEEHMETLRQAHLEQEEQYKRWQKEQQQKQEELAHIREKRWKQQLQSWQQEMQKKQDQEQQCKVPEKQRLIQKEPKPSSPKLKVVESSVLDIFVKPCKMPPVSKEKIICPTPWLTPSSSIALKEDSSEPDTTWFPKMFTKIKELPTYDITEKRYWINVEAQRKNLKLLRESSQKAGVSPDLYNDTKETIKLALHSNVEKLALLFRKYKSFYNLHEVRHSLILQLDTAKEAKDSAKMQNLYKMVDKVDAYQKRLLDSWKVKQSAVEKQRQHCLTKMVDLFAQLRSGAQLHLSNPCPLIVKAEDSTKKETFHMPHIRSVVLKSRVYKSPLIRVKKSQDFTVTAMVRRKPSNEQIESLWKTDITELSFPLGPKVPVSFLWSESCGFPDIPRFLELDISSVRRKPLRNMETRIQNIPRWKISGYNFKHL